MSQDFNQPSPLYPAPPDAHSFDPMSEEYQPTPPNPKSKLVRTLARYIVLWGIIFLIVKFVVPSYEVKGASMVPTYHSSGDRVLTDQLFFKLTGGPSRGDIVILSEPNAAEGKDDLIKRVIGLPGEKLEVREGTVYINDQALAEAYIQNKARYNYPVTTLPAQCYFVLGDNRPVSYDSHYFGCVPKDRLVAHVLLTYPWHF